MRYISQSYIPITRDTPLQWECKGCLETFIYSIHQLDGRKSLCRSCTRERRLDIKDYLYFDPRLNSIDMREKANKAFYKSGARISKNYFKSNEQEFSESLERGMSDSDFEDIIIRAATRLGAIKKIYESILKGELKIGTKTYSIDEGLEYFRNRIVRNLKAPFVKQVCDQMIGLFVRMLRLIK